ncbi:RNA splicing factor PRP9 [Dichomitus squalens LYAD-421 SS1]|uniref:RNA splicing factor PRP9 n=2 Tax=Dichomitus squalens TaxID=114155 RepID=A0A4Q9N014_9APHY|nr:RNA splicing factor PRP9 [Dichomitus squalens LYAD-421 SS1]EJF56615.1 RNA splicing factor PRP9 [Dichomitus squalens LYAD-421 SS1]TBU33187.1 RNA splicing factor PRP9 [Dichomitus squalens]
MDSVIEVQRQTHEEIEHLERALYATLSKTQSTHQVRLQNEHKASQLLDRIHARVVALNNLYEDQDTRKAEIDSLSAPPRQDDLSAFYDRLSKIQEHHAKYPDSVVGGFELELAAFVDEAEELDGEEFEQDDPIALLFSGEEGYGKYLDLYANHTTYNNLKHIGKRLAYLQYLDVLLAAQSSTVHTELPKECRLHRDYELYIRALHAYLLSFMKRSQPLIDIESQQREAEQQFNQAWEELGLAEEWEDSKQAKAATGENGESIGIWCTACQKMYSKQTVYDAHLNSKKHIKAAQKQSESDAPPPNPNGPTPTNGAHSVNSNGDSSKASDKNKHRTAALFTHLVSQLLRELASALNDTKSNVERRFSLTAREREQELLEQAKKPPPPTKTPANGEGAEEEEEEERIYNPLKLPLGWDGKPIPYWLYKLHGLGVEYRCEICSDHVYMGRKNFDRHFQESRHAFGMRALGLPNTKHFHEITRIEDALALAEKLKREGRTEIFEQETMEELEDEEGNVYNRKTYEDLKKQGLI